MAPGLMTAMTVGENTLYFSYDADDTPMSVKYGDEEYFYTSNIQGDVIGIVNDQSQTVVTYSYDAWGRQLSCTGSMASTLGTINPLRYRGYVYDQDSGLYYLQSRYYNPEHGRFINADCYYATGQGFSGNNVFVYCGNNPILRNDPAGEWFGVDDLIAAGVGALKGVATQFISDCTTSLITGSWEFSSWEEYAGSAIGGAAEGVVTIYFGPLAGAAVDGAVSTLATEGLKAISGKDTLSAGELIAETTRNAAWGVFSTRYLDVKIKGITSGRNSMQAVYDSGLTKINNKTAGKMSPKVVGKGITSGIVSGSLSSTIEGLYNAIVKSR